MSSRFTFEIGGGLFRDLPYPQFEFRPSEKLPATGLAELIKARFTGNVTGRLKADGSRRTGSIHIRFNSQRNRFRAEFEGGVNGLRNAMNGLEEPDWNAIIADEIQPHATLDLAKVGFRSGMAPLLRAVEYGGISTELQGDLYEDGTLAGKVESQIISGPWEARNWPLATREKGPNAGCRRTSIPTLPHERSTSHRSVRYAFRRGSSRLSTMIGVDIAFET